MAKKKAPQRLAGAEESCISPEQEAIIQWFRTVKFRKNLLGGVDEAAMWKKLEELYALYEAAIRAERTRYNVLLETSPSKPSALTERFLYSSGAMTLSSTPARWSRVLPSQMLSRVGSTSRQNFSVFWKSFSMAEMQAVSFIQTASSKWW